MDLDIIAHHHQTRYLIYLNNSTKDVVIYFNDLDVFHFFVCNTDM